MYAAGEGAAHAAILEHLAADAADRDLAVLHQVRLSDGAGLRVLRPEGDGEPWIEVFTHDGARATGAERFDLDDLDAALIRFEELSTGCHGAVRQRRVGGGPPCGGRDPGA